MNPIFALVLSLPAPGLPAVSPAPIARPTPVAVVMQSADELVAAGRAHLAAGRNVEALASFEAAEKLDGSLKIHQWVLRAWIAQGRVNDTLGAVDALVKGGANGPPIDYLYGMAFSQKAKGYIVEGVNGGIVGMAFGDAVDFLKKATAADPKLYTDAFLPLAESAWYAQDFDTARAAADKATGIAPDDGEAWRMLGRVAFSQYKALREDETRAQDAESAWTAANNAFGKAKAIFAASTDAGAVAKSAEASMELGWLHAWKQQGDEAAKAFAEAIAVDPTAVDFGAMRNNLSPEQYATALEDASKQYEARYGKNTTGDAALLWWLGFAEYTAKRYGEAEAAFTRAVAKEPSFVNSWYYVALARYFRQDYDGAIAGLRTQFGISADDTIASLRANQDENLRILDYMIGMKAGRAANLDAAFLSELQARMVPDNDRYWNNLGLFLRDEGEGRERRGKKQRTPEEQKQIQDLYERSYAAYTKSLELSPNDPNYLNDAALMLHYHLDRDLDQARAWYLKSTEMAEAELAKPTLDKEVRGLREIALRDSKNNLRDLDKILDDRRKAKEAAEAAEKAKRENPPAPPPLPPEPPKPQ